LQIICPRLKFKKKPKKKKGKISTTANFFEIRRNKIKGGNDKGKLVRKKMFKEDAEVEEDDQKVKRVRKARHYTDVVISDDSSDISFTEVKLANLYEKSYLMQRDLIKATSVKDFNVKFRDALKNVVKLDVLKE
jgi:hypothetical protein